MVGQEIADNAFNTQGRPSSELLDIAEQKIYKIAKTNKTNSFVKTSELLGRLSDRMDYVSNNKGALTGLDTGFTELNKITNGLQNSDLIIIAGTPGTGKTSFAINIATYAIQQQQTVAIFSLEMPDLQLGNKIVSSLSKVNLQRVSYGPIASDWPKITEAMNALDKFGNYLQIDDSPALSSLELRSKARKLASQQGLDLI